MPDIYIASCTAGGGIYHYKYNGTTVKEYSFTEMDRPMYLKKHGDRMYAILRDPYNTGASAVAVYKIGPDGSLLQKTDEYSTLGSVGCHLAVADKGIFAANYISGSVFRTPDLLVTHSGRGTHPTRQEAPHVHCTEITPDGKYVCVCDLGVDKVIVYDLSLNKVSVSETPPGSGPRHITFSESGREAYLVCELSSEVIFYDYSDGVLKQTAKVKALPSDCTDESIAAAIRCNGDYLYTSNRGHDSISVINIRDRRLITTVPCGGKSPRDFNITGDTLVCTNENSGNITFFKLKNGIPERTETEIKLNNPLCVVFG